MLSWTRSIHSLAVHSFMYQVIIASEFALLGDSRGYTNPISILSSLVGRDDFRISFNIVCEQNMRIRNMAFSWCYCPNWLFVRNKGVFMNDHNIAYTVHSLMTPTTHLNVFIVIIYLRLQPFFTGHCLSEATSSHAIPNLNKIWICNTSLAV